MFPAYTGPHQLAAISRLVRWTSFWRRTDPLGFTIQACRDETDPARLVDVDEHVLSDPERLCPTGGEVISPPIRNHSDYPYDGTYQRECRRIRNRLALVR